MSDTEKFFNGRAWRKSEDDAFVQHAKLIRSDHPIWKHLKRAQMVFKLSERVA